MFDFSDDYCSSTTSQVREAKSVSAVASARKANMASKRTNESLAWLRYPSNGRRTKKTTQVMMARGTVRTDNATPIAVLAFSRQTLCLVIFLLISMSRRMLGLIRIRFSVSAILTVDRSSARSM